MRRAAMVTFLLALACGCGGGGEESPDATVCLQLTGSDPADLATDVPLVSLGSSDFRVLLQFSEDLDITKLDGIEMTAGSVAVAVANITLSADSLMIVFVTVAGGLASNTEYLVSIGAGADGPTSVLGHQLCQPVTVTFTTI